MLKKTVLHEAHCQQGALMVPFAGWEMPLHYGSQLEEHHTVRKDAGVFDVSHMGILDVKGENVQPFLRYVLANNIDKMTKPGRALYGCLLNEKAGILDDLITYYISPVWYRMVVNAGTVESDLVWLEKQANQFGEVEIFYRTDLAILAVQGPNARKKAAHALGDSYSGRILALEPFQFFIENNWMVASTGYTGEDGIEIMLTHEEAVTCWQALQRSGVHSIGLGARDTLRLEAGYNLYGQDMDNTVTPFESNLGWTVPLLQDGRAFIGREVLEQQKKTGVVKKLISLVLLEKGILRHDQRVLNENETVGVVTSGTFSPTLNRSIAFARVECLNETDYAVLIRDKRVKVKKVNSPFVKKGKATFLL